MIRFDSDIGEYVPEDGSAKSVDWLDVLNSLGDARVRGMFESVLGTNAEEPPPADTHDEFELYYPADHADAAIMFLCEMFPSPKPDRETGATFTLVTWDEQIYQRAGGSWVPCKRVILMARARRWARSKMVKKPYKYKDDDGNTVTGFNDEPYRPNDKSLSELLSAIMAETVIETDAMGVWLESAYSANKSIPMYTEDPARRVLTTQQAKAEGLKDPRDYLQLQDGMLDLDALRDDRIEITPPTERMFAADAIPHSWPKSATKAAAAGKMDAWFKKHCPLWLANLERIDAGRKNFSWILVRDVARAMIADLSLKKFPIWQGSSGSGKTTTLDPIAAVFGSACDGAMTFEALSETAQLYTMIGKRAVVFHDDDVTKKTDIKSVTRTLKIMTEGGMLRSRPLYNKEPINFENTALPIILVNEMPNLRDTAGALVKRMRCYAFLGSIRDTAQDDPTFADRLMLEVQAIMVYLVWMGLRPYLQDLAAGKDPLPKPDGHSDLADTFTEQADMLGVFVEDCLRPWSVLGVEGVRKGDQPSISHEFLYSLFERWVERTGRETSFSSPMFGVKLQSHLSGFPAHKRPAVQRDQDGEVRGKLSTWFGVGLRHGVLAELFDGPNDPGLMLYGVTPKDELDYDLHQQILNELNEPEPA